MTNKLEAALTEAHILGKVITEREHALLDAKNSMAKHLLEMENLFMPKHMLGWVLTGQIQKPQSGYSYLHDSKKSFDDGFFPLTFGSKNWRDSHHDMPIMVSSIALERIEKVHTDDGLKDALIWRIYAIYRRKTDGAWSKQEISTNYVDLNFKSN